MYVRASFVIENSVLIPLFTGIIVTLILFGMRWHDELVVDSIKLQVALKLEQEKISHNISTLPGKEEKIWF